jgi:RNA polymerase sigma factor (sigma-70 family)
MCCSSTAPVIYERAVNLVPPLTSVTSSEAKTAQDTRLDDLLDRYGAFLRRIIVRVCPAELRVSCDDIEQEARISLWKVLGSEREIVFPASYIYKVAVSATRRAIKRARARREDPLEQEGDDAGIPRHMPQAPRHAAPDNMAERGEWIRKIEIAVAQLPETRRLAVELHLQDLTTREIGEILGWSEPKARNLLYRGLKDLRKSLRAIGIEYQP